MEYLIIKLSNLCFATKTTKSSVNKKQCRNHVRGQFQNQPPIGWLKKYKTENKTLLYGTVTDITALLHHVVAIHI